MGALVTVWLGSSMLGLQPHARPGSPEIRTAPFEASPAHAVDTERPVESCGGGCPDQPLDGEPESDDTDPIRPDDKHLALVSGYGSCRELCPSGGGARSARGRELERPPRRSA